MIRKAEISDIKTVTELAILLWPDNSISELENSMNEYLLSAKAVLLLAFDNSEPVGFAQCQLRTDYIEGTNSSPVGYLEGIYVKSAYRSKGIAKQLLTNCEVWAKEKNCSEFASDCELTNSDSLDFHLKAGFIEANRIICFTKKL